MQDDHRPYHNISIIVFSECCYRKAIVIKTAVSINNIDKIWHRNTGSSQPPPTAVTVNSAVNGAFSYCFSGGNANPLVISYEIFLSFFSSQHEDLIPGIICIGKLVLFSFNRHSFKEPLFLIRKG